MLTIHLTDDTPTTDPLLDLVIEPRTLVIHRPEPVLVRTIRARAFGTDPAPLIQAPTRRRWWHRRG